MTADLPTLGKLGVRNRIALIDQRMIIARATPNMEGALASAAGTIPSLADAPEYQAAIAALNDAHLADAGPLMSAMFIGDPFISDPAAILGSRTTPEQIKKIQEAFNLQPRLTPYALSVFATYHNAGKTYLVMALVFSAGSDAETAATNLGERIQNYTSLRTNRPFLDSIHAKYERAFAVDANGLPVAVVVLSADDPSADSTVVPDWTRVIYSRDVGFLFINP